MSKLNRIERLRSKGADKELDAFLVTSSENRAYFSGFRGSAGNLWITKDDASWATDFRYTEQAAIDMIPEMRVATSSSEDAKEGLASFRERRAPVFTGK